MSKEIVEFLLRFNGFGSTQYEEDTDYDNPTIMTHDFKSSLQMVEDGSYISWMEKLK